MCSCERFIKIPSHILFHSLESSLENGRDKLYRCANTYNQSDVVDSIGVDIWLYFSPFDWSASFDWDWISHVRHHDVVFFFISLSRSLDREHKTHIHVVQYMLNSINTAIKLVCLFWCFFLSFESLQHKFIVYLVKIEASSKASISLATNECTFEHWATNPIAHAYRFWV